MMKKTIRYGLMLSDAELDYLSENKYGINRMKVLRCLIGAAVMEDTPYEKKGFSTTLKAGQAILSEVELAGRLGYDKKTVSRLIDRFNQMGIVASTQGNRTSVHELRCLAASVKAIKASTRAQYFSHTQFVEQWMKAALPLIARWEEIMDNLTR